MNHEAMELLRDWLAHKPSCAFSSAGDCTCGLDRALLAQPKAAQVAVPIGKPVEQSIADQQVGSSAAPDSGEGMPPEPSGLGPYKSLSQELRTEAEHLHSPPTYWRDLFLKAAKHIEDMRSYALSLRGREGMVLVPMEPTELWINKYYARSGCHSVAQAKKEIMDMLITAPPAGEGEEKG